MADMATSSTHTSSGSPWWESFYDEHLALVLLDQKQGAHLAATLEFLEQHAPLQPGDRIFDQCCGTGRISIPLARRGYTVVGVDQAESYIERAQQEATEEGLDASFFCADAFEFLPEQPVQAVINWWTSFGYSDDSENQTMLRRAYEALKPGGVFVLDFMNLLGVLHDFQPVLVNRVEGPNGEVTLLLESEIDAVHGRLLKRWTYLLPGGHRTVHHTSVRLYLPHQIIAMMEAEGFDTIQTFGSVLGDPLGLKSPRCILLGRKE